MDVVETEQTDNAEPADDDIDERDVRVEFVEESPGYYTKGKQHHIRWWNVWTSLLDMWMKRRRLKKIMYNKTV